MVQRSKRCFIIFMECFTDPKGPVFVTTFSKLKIRATDPRQNWSRLARPHQFLCMQMPVCRWGSIACQMYYAPFSDPIQKPRQSSKQHFFIKDRVWLWNSCVRIPQCSSTARRIGIILVIELAVDQPRSTLASISKPQYLCFLKFLSVEIELQKL